MSAEQLDTALLRTFVAIVDCGSFSAAAQRLGLGQPAISLQLKRLEDRLGVRLLERGPRRIAPTLEGELVLEQARRILALSEELVARAREPELEGAVRLGAPEDFATTRLPPLLSEFSANYPRVSLEVTCELTLELLERFDAGGLDLALIKREPAGGNPGRRVWREPLVWVAADVAIAETDPIPLVCSPQPCVLRKRAIRALDGVGRRWRVAYSCGSLAGNHAALHARLGVTALPLDMVPRGLLILDNEECGLPPLYELEVALLEAPALTAPAKRLRDYIVRALEHGTPPPGGQTLN